MSLCSPVMITIPLLAHNNFPPPPIPCSTLERQCKEIRRSFCFGSRTNEVSPTWLPHPDRHPEELWGLEDPRISYLAELGKCAVVYTAFSKAGPLVSLAYTSDFHSFERQGPIMPPEDKDAALFPERFHGCWAVIHRPRPAGTLYKANIWISFEFQAQILFHESPAAAAKPNSTGSTVARANPLR